MKRLAILLLLSGCGSPQELAIEHDRTCKEWGAKPGTEAYFKCRAMQQARTDAQNAAIADAIIGSQPKTVIIKERPY